ncbi:MAG: metal-dependent hydrolase [Deltaproteobacteria bacterium]|nr:metal-dependent hydrolase [Deltaproteobacteria bacterium]
MTWIEHSAAGGCLHLLSRATRRPLPLSLLLLGSTLLPDLDHLWSRALGRPLLAAVPSVELGFWLSSGTWTHSLVGSAGAAWLASLLFADRRLAFHAFLWAGLLHLVGDWAYRQVLFYQGILWLWPLSSRLY